MGEMTLVQVVLFDYDISIWLPLKATSLACADGGNESSISRTLHSFWLQHFYMTVNSFWIQYFYMTAAQSNQLSLCRWGKWASVSHKHSFWLHHFYMTVILFDYNISIWLPLKATSLACADDGEMSLVSSRHLVLGAGFLDNAESYNHSCCLLN